MIFYVPRLSFCPAQVSEQQRGSCRSRGREASWLRSRPLLLGTFAGAFCYLCAKVSICCGHCHVCVCEHRGPRPSVPAWQSRLRPRCSPTLLLPGSGFSQPLGLVCNFVPLLRCLSASLCGTFSLPHRLRSWLAAQRHVRALRRERRGSGRSQGLLQEPRGGEVS